MFFLFFISFYTNLNGILLPNNRTFTPKTSLKSVKSNIPKWYFVIVNNEKIFEQNPSFFTPQNFIGKNFYKMYLNTTEFSNLSKSKYVDIYDVPSDIKNGIQNDIKRNIQSQSSHQAKSNFNNIFIVHAAENFMEEFEQFGTIRKINHNYFSITVPNTKFILQNVGKKENNLNFDNSATLRLINELKESPLVFSFSEMPEVKSLNRFATGYVQSGSYDTWNYNGSIKSKNPLHELGYTGKDEVVTISDTGLAPGIAWFKDDNYDYPYDKTNFNHRKVVRYNSYSSQANHNQDDYSGHGSHVACSVCGSITDYSSFYTLYNGVAPDAKAFIVDLEDGNGNMMIDIGIYSTIGDMATVQSYVNSNSWGVDADSGSEIEKIYNELAVEYQDKLFVFAAGNDGRYRSINIPGSAKNVLTVGALAELPTNKLNSSSVSSSNYKLQLIIHDINRLDTVEEVSGFAKTITRITDKNDHKIMYNKSVSAYSSTINTYSASDAIIPKTCDEAITAVTKGAQYLILPNSPSFESCSVQNKENIFAYVYQNMEYDDLVADLKDKHVSANVVLTSSDSVSHPTIAQFSSCGPSTYGAVKPEVVAPGTNITSSSRIASGVAVGSGTSMATPIVSGAIATLRQYLRTKYPNLIIKSHLLKAIIIASADKSSPKTPNPALGFGRINLANVIPELSNTKLVFQSDLKIPAEETRVFSFEVTSTQYDVRVVLNYLDQGSSSVMDLMNIKANLNVITPNNKMLFPINEKAEDSFSTVERIYIPKDELIIGKYIIVIRTSKAIFGKTQPYKTINASLVCVGDVTGIQTEAQSIVNWNDFCDPDHSVSASKLNGCTCDDYSTGLNCQHKIEEIAFNEKSTFTLETYETRYFVSPISAKDYKQFYFKWTQASNYYLMLRLNIDSSHQRINHYDYFYASNKSSATISGPLDSSNNYIQYTVGTKIYYCFTNFGPTSVKITIQTILDGKSGSSSSGGNDTNPLSIVVGVVVAIVAVGFVLVFVVACLKKKKNKNRQVSAQSDSSSSTSSSRQRNNYINGNNNGNYAYNNGGYANYQQNYAYSVQSNAVNDNEPAYYPPDSTIQQQQVQNAYYADNIQTSPSKKHKNKHNTNQNYSNPGNNVMPNNGVYIAPLPPSGGPGAPPMYYAPTGMPDDQGFPAMNAQPVGVPQPSPYQQPTMGYQPNPYDLPL
ncbi:hypothetical protein TRFO_25604 [Tritrichomonas foetus]|uniref:SWIM-type domain-containing protein n=1 Tax=Tritrichomonas foetus TaxID=1144522 RepID=A0A1J4KA55_9EUKA|nr:hypothetical protein TRFO_25604 [Tritrichomonas foetus]|eukprot:OHT06333.1 hypothetical protein TRFO_25604 [Tritrichomonas foetus]